MKTLYFFAIITLFTLVTSCSNDDDSNFQITNQSTWSLTHVGGGLAGVDQTIPEGVLLWTFNSDTQMLIVVNNNTDEDIFDFFDSGSYPYSIETNGTDDTMTIDGIDFGTIIETQNELTLDHQVLDGFILTLTR